MRGNSVNLGLKFQASKVSNQLRTIYAHVYEMYVWMYVYTLKTSLISNANVDNV